MNPYPGLRPFRDDEDYLFFGREEQTAELLRLLGEHRFLAVVGTSGSGKSSLVRAGLLPELQGGTLTDAGSAWEIALLRPGGDPLLNLAEALCDADLYDADDPSAVPRLLATLGHSGRGLVEAYRQSDVEKGANLLVVVDQFEELFRFHDTGDVSRDRARAFVSLLLEAAQQKDVPLYVVLTMRSDYLGDCAQIRGLAEAVNEGEYLIPRLTRTQLRAAIEGPARVGGGAIAERLVQHLLNDGGDRPDQLPVLQHALMRTWDVWTSKGATDREIDLDDYEATGGMSEALSRHADEVFSALSTDEQRAVAERVFRALTEKASDNRGIRRPTRLSELTAIVGAAGADVRSVIDAYRQPGVTFLMPGLPRELRPETVVDLSHESLMRVWQRLRNWVEIEAQSARVYERLRETADLWRQNLAGLYHDPDLQIALTWRDEHRPTASWAAQYGGRFELAVEFLEASRTEAERETKEKEAARQRELEQANALAEAQARAARNFRHFAVGMGVLAVVAAALCVWAFILKAESEENERAAAESARAERASAEQAQSERARAEREAEQARLARAAAEAAQVEAHSLLVESRHEQGAVWLERARTLVEEKSFFAAKMFAARAVGFEGYGAADRDAEFRTLYPPLLRPESLERTQVEELMRMEEYPLVWVTPSAALEARVLAIAANDARASAGAVDGTVRSWSISSGEELPMIGDAGNQSMLAIAVTAEDSYLAIARSDGDVEIWNLREHTHERTLDHTGPVYDIAFTAQGDRIVTGSALTTVRIWKVSTGEMLHELGGHLGPVYAVDFAPDGKLLASGGADNTVRVWDSADGSEVQRFDHPANVRELRFSPNGEFLAATSRDVTVRRTDSWSEVFTANVLGAAMSRNLTRSGLDFSPDSRWVVVRGDSTTIGVRDLNTGTTRAVDSVVSAAGPVVFTPSGDLVVAGDRTLRIVEFPSGTDRGNLADGHAGPVRAVDISPDGRTIVSASDDGTLRFWDVATGEGRRTLDGLSRRVIWVQFSPDGSRLVTCDHERRVRIWDVDSHEAVVEIHGPAARATFHPDGILLAFGRSGGTIALWDLADDRLVTTLESGDADVNDVEFHPDGTQLLSTSEDGSVRLWDVATGTALVTLESQSMAFDAEFSPDGATFATSGPRDVILWDTLTRERTAILDGHDDRVESIAFSADGELIATASIDGSIRVWRTVAGTLVTTLESHSGAVYRARFSPDGRSIVSGGDDHAVRLWEVPNRTVGLISHPTEPYYGARISPDGSVIAAGVRGGVKLIDPAVRREIAELALSLEREPFGLRFDRTGARLAAVEVLGNQTRASIVVWNLATRERLGSFPGPPPINAQIDFQPGGDLVASPMFGPGITLWDAALRHAVAQISETEQIFAVCFSSDGALLASGALSGALRLWNVETRTLVREFTASSSGAAPEGAAAPERAHSKVLTRTVFQPSGDLLASASIDGNVRLWNVETGELVTTFSGHATSSLVEIVFSPDGKLLASVSAQGDTVRFFDVETRSLLDTRTGEESTPFDLSFSGSGAVLVVGALNSAIRMWDARVGLPARERYARYLDRYDFSGRSVVPRRPVHLFRMAGVPLEPLYENSHLSALYAAGDSAWRELVERYVFARNWPAAAAVLDEVPIESARDERVELAETLVRVADDLHDRGQSRLALRRLDLSESLGGRPSALFTRRARIRLALGERERAFENLGTAIDHLRAETPVDHEALTSLLEERVRFQLATRDFGAAGAELGALLAELEAPERRLRAVQEYLDAAAADAVAGLSSDPASRRRVVALALLELFLASYLGGAVDSGRLEVYAPLLGDDEDRDTRLVERNGEWEYPEENPSRPEAGWMTAESRGDWSIGLAPFGFGDSRESTPLSRGAIAYYVRRRFTFAPDDISGGVRLRVELSRDDGAVLYLNGQEILRDNLPNGPIEPSTMASVIQNNDDEVRWRTFTVSGAEHLRPGENLLAAAIHQSTANSSDLHFDAALTAVRTIPLYLAALPEEEINAALAEAIAEIPVVIRAIWAPLIDFSWGRGTLAADISLADALKAWRARRVILGELDYDDAESAALTTELELFERAREELTSAERYALQLYFDEILRARDLEAEADRLAREWVASELLLAGALRLNGGGGAFVSADDTAWGADRFFSGGGTYLDGARSLYVDDIPGTEDDPLYQTERFFRPGTAKPHYRIPVPNGRYRVTFHANEIWYPRGGNRIFGGRIEGVTVFENYDPFESAGQHGKPHVQQFDVEVTDEWLDLELVHGRDNPKISALEVSPIREP